MTRTKLAVLCVVIGSLAGCGRQAVRAAEKEFLADQIMVFDEDPHAAAGDVVTSRKARSTTSPVPGKRASRAMAARRKRRRSTGRRD